MKSMAAMLLGLFCVCASAAEAPAVSAANAPSSEADAAWLEIQSSGAPQTMEWKGEKPPTPAEADAYKKRLAQQLLREADKAKDFYTKFPTHLKADAARAKEKKLREDAASFGPVDKKPDRPARDPVFEARLQAALGEVEAVKALGPAAIARQYEDIGRKLAKEFPTRDEPYMLMELSTRASSPGKTIAMYREIAASAPPGEFHDRVAAELAARDVVNKTISVTGPTLKGDTVDLQKYRGKVVLLDFWATWCPGCVSLTPGLLAIYDKYHDKGFEIIGINLDEDAGELKQYVERHHVPWPQIADVTRNGSALARQFRAQAIPMLFVIDKTGKVRDIDPIDHLVSEIQFLLDQP